MQTNIADVYAAGDIVQFPLYLNGDQHTNIQHWQMACKHGNVRVVSSGKRSCTVQVLAKNADDWAVVLVSALYGAGAAAYAGKTRLRV